MELEIRQLIVTALKLEDLQPEDIATDEPLFGDEGLGLDSIDALELGVAIRKTFGIKLDTVNDEVKAHFASLRSLTAFIRAEREGGNA